MYKYDEQRVLKAVEGISKEFQKMNANLKRIIEILESTDQKFVYAYTNKELPNTDYIPPMEYKELGNDDLAL